MCQDKSRSSLNSIKNFHLVIYIYIMDLLEGPNVCIFWIYLIQEIYSVFFFWLLSQVQIISITPDGHKCGSVLFVSASLYVFFSNLTNKWWFKVKISLALESNSKAIILMHISHHVLGQQTRQPSLWLTPLLLLQENNSNIKILHLLNAWHELSSLLSTMNTGFISPIAASLLPPYYNWLKPTIIDINNSLVHTSVRIWTRLDRVKSTLLFTDHCCLSEPLFPV